MAYTSNIPQPPDNPSDSQGLILDNFTEISTAFNLNHGNFNDPSIQGKHKFLQMPQQAAGPATTATEGAVYTKAVSGATQLFYRDQSSGTERQMTGAFTAATTGQFNVPGGLIFSWGSLTFTTTPSATVTPAGFTTLFNVQFSVFGNTANIFAVEGRGANGFRFLRNAGTSSTTVQWFATGE